MLEYLAVLLAIKSLYIFTFFSDFPIDFSIILASFENLLPVKGLVRESENTNLSTTTSL